MFEQFKTLPELLDYFKDQNTCMRYWEQIRWGDNVCCIHCGCCEVWRTNRGFTCGSKSCGKKFSALVGSIFENTKLPLRIWFATIFLLTTSKKGISALQLSRQFGITHKTAWYMLHRIRTAYREVAPEELEGTVQVDECFVGGRNKNRHWDKKLKYKGNRVFDDKTPVMGMLSGDKVYCCVVTDTGASSLLPVIRKVIKPGSTIYSDEWQVYKGIDDEYHREVVEHSRGQYRNGNATTNGIENFWSTFKKGMIGIYQKVGRQHLQRYVNEFVFRFNHRLMKVEERFTAALRCCCLVRITYRELIN